MALTQETFLGASIRNFSSSLGWGTQASTLEVGLVEDDKNGDVFDPPPVGSPVYFEYQNWHFGGILQSYVKNYGQQGNPVYTVQVQDPRELLDGVQLILQDYADTTYTSSVVPNIYNIYGYLENQYGYGSSQVNDTGIPWKLIVKALSELEALYPISFRGNFFRFVPFYGLTNILPDYYRVGSDSISLLGFVREICDAIAADFFIGMTYAPEYVGYTNNIGLHMINRSTPLADDKIEEYINGAEGAVAKEIGHELRNEVTTKFLTGGKVNSLYYQPQQYVGNDKYNITYDNTIWPFWGYDCFDRLIVMNANGTFRLDGRSMALQTGYPWMVNYPTDVNEMRAAIDGQDSWESYIWMHNDNPNSVHYQKASLFGIVDGWNLGLIGLIKVFAGDAKVDKDVGRNISRLRMDSTKGFYQNSKLGDNLSKIYQWISGYANEYYGKRFMVRIPFVLGARIPETDEIRFSVNPSDGGFVDSAEWAQASWNGYIPFNPLKFTLDDGRIMSYARFSRVQEVDFDDKEALPAALNSADFNVQDLGVDNYIIEQLPNVSLGKMREYVWVRAELDPQLVFLDSTTLFSPRVVITLPGRIRTGSNDNTAISERVDSIIQGMEPDEVHENLKEDAEGRTDLINNFANKLSAGFGSDLIWFGQESTAAVPDLAAVALESNILRYGPWYAAGSAGKVEYEADETLVPWNYNGYTILNLVGNSRVSDALSSLQVSEKGTIEFPGVPDRSLGEALLDSGPTITDINVNVGEEGVTTKYNMSTWTWRFGRAGKYNLDRLIKLNKIVQDQRKGFRQMFSSRGNLASFSSGQKESLKKWMNQSRRLGHNSSIGLLAGDVIVSGSGDSLKVVPSVAAIAGYRAQSQTDPNDYAKQAGMSLDGMFVPYSTAQGELSYESLLPKFETPDEDASSPTVDDLNPFGSRGVAVAFPESEGVPAELNTELNSEEYSGDVKGIGLKAPIIVGGWGRDLNNRPVPASSGDLESFVDNYKTRADLWKVGPLDIRWDARRKVWNAGGGGTSLNKIGKLAENLYAGDETDVYIYGPTSSGDHATGEIQENVKDWLLPDNTFLPAGTKAIISEIGDRWYVLAASPPC